MIEDGINDSSEIFDRKNHFLLVVDSDAENLFYTSSLLKRFDYKPVIAKSAREALQVAASCVPALIITALGLSDMRGVELIKHIRRNPATAHIPVITIERRRRQSVERDSADVCADSNINRPVSPEALHRAVQNAVETTPRANIRIRTLLSVKVNNIPFDCPTGDCTATLSERGVFLPTLQPVAVDTRVSLQIQIYEQSIPIESVVLYSYPPVRQQDHEPGMTLEFVQIEPKYLELIRHYIRDEITRHITPGNA